MSADRIAAIILAMLTVLSGGDALMQRQDKADAGLTAEVLSTAIRGYDEALRGCRARLGAEE